MALTSDGTLNGEKFGADLLAERADELLLAGDAVEIRVGMAVADEVERLPARELLVAGHQVDVREVVVDRARVLVVVAPVDVHPDAPELVDDLLEPVEVDRDQVVDRQVGQLLDGQQRARGARSASRRS